MIKYKIVIQNKTIEFATEAAAQEYKTLNNLSEPIESFDEEIIESKNVPDTISSRQIRLALTISGISLSEIENTIDSLPEPDSSLTKITWEYATIFERHHPMIVALGSQLSLNSDQIDNLFILGADL